MKSAAPSKRGVAIAGLVGALFLFGVASATAGDFVSFNGKFHITYPENWKQVDYSTADYYIGQAKGELNYEAVFHKEDSLPLFEGSYLILTIDTVGNLTQQQIDSVLDVLTGAFDKQIAESSPEEFLVEANKEVIVYDRENQAVAIISDVTEEEVGPRRNVLAMKFFEQGIANFYFYSPGPSFETCLPEFRAILASFATGTLERSAQAEPVRIADIEDDGGSGTVFAYIPVAVVLAIVIGIVVRRRRRRVKQHS